MVSDNTVLIKCTVNTVLALCPLLNTNNLNMEKGTGVNMHSPPQGVHLFKKLTTHPLLIFVHFLIKLLQSRFAVYHCDCKHDLLAVVVLTVTVK